MSVTNVTDALEYQDLLLFIEKNYPEYEADFVFNPRNHLIKNSLVKRGADFDKEQIKMVYTHKYLNVKRRV